MIKRHFFLSAVFLAGVFLQSGSAHAQCAGGYTNAIGDRICGTDGGNVPAVAPQIQGATRSIPIGGGPLYIPNIPPINCGQLQTYDDNGVSFTSGFSPNCNDPYFNASYDPVSGLAFLDKIDQIGNKMDDLTSELEDINLTVTEMERIDEILTNGVSPEQILEYEGDFTSFTTNDLSFDLGGGFDLNYSFDTTNFMNQSISDWTAAEVNTVLGDASQIVQNFPSADQLRVQEILDVTPVDELMNFGPLASVNTLDFDIGLTSGGLPLDLSYDVNSFMDEVVSDFTEEQVTAKMDDLTGILDGFSEAELIAATEGVLDGQSITDIMNYGGDLNTVIENTFTLATDADGNPIEFLFAQNEFMGTLVTPYSLADAQAQADAISAAIAGAGLTDSELSSLQSVIAGMTREEVMDFSGDIIETATTTFDLATDSLGGLIQFDFNAQTFMGTAITGYDPLDVDDRMAQLTDSLAGLSDADLAIVQAELDTMTIDDIMNWTEPFVVSGGGGGTDYQVATLSDGITPVTFNSGTASFMGTPLGGEAYTPAEIQAVADAIALEIAGAPDGALTNIQAVLDSMTATEIMDWPAPYVHVDTIQDGLGGFINVGYFMGSFVYSEPVV